MSIEDVKGKKLEKCLDKKKKTICISDNLKIDFNEKKVISNKVIIIDANIKCSGNIIIENCDILVKENYNNYKVNLKEATVFIKNSKIKFTGKKDNFFVKSEKSNITFENTIFEGCNSFIKDNNSNITILNCHGIELDFGFIKQSYSGGILKIKNSTFLAKEDQDKNNLDENFLELLSFEIENCKFNNFINCIIIEMDLFSDKSSIIRKCIFENNKIEDKDKISSAKVFITESLISKCYFINYINCISGNFLMKDKVNVRDCYFENCKNVIAGVKNISGCTFKRCEKIIVYKNTLELSKCKFIECVGKIIYGLSCIKANIEFCEFKDCKLKDIDDYKFSYLQKNSMIELSSFEKGCSYKIYKCEFKGIHMKNSNDKLIVTNIDNISDETICDISNCVFNQSSPVNEMIECYSVIYRTFGKDKNVKSISINNCNEI